MPSSESRMVAVVESRMIVVNDALIGYYRKRLKRQKLPASMTRPIVIVEFDAQYNKNGVYSQGRVYVQTSYSRYDSWHIDLDGCLYVVEHRGGRAVNLGAVFIY